MTRLVWYQHRAALLSREYEQGTFRFAWTQGTGRTRWCALKLNAFGVLIVRQPVLAGAGRRRGRAGGSAAAARRGHALAGQEPRRQDSR
jgi:hypothetical protein